MIVTSHRHSMIIFPLERRLWNFVGTHKIHKRFLTESTGSTWVGKEERDNVELSTHICFDDRCLTHMWDAAHSERITILWCKHREQEKACAWLGQFKWVYQTHIQNRFIFAQPENQPQTQLIWTFIIMLQIFNIYCTTTKFVFSKYLHTGIRDSPKKLRIRRILALTKYIILLRSAVVRCYVWFSVCLPHITSIWRTFGVWICIFVDNFKSWRISVTCFD